MQPRLVLWDIDRTLIFAGGVDKGVWVEVCSELVGRPVTDLVGTSGRTDPQILLDALLQAGVEETEARRLLPRRCGWRSGGWPQSRMSCAPGAT
jgi:phosphoglycolate phosphatase